MPGNCHFSEAWLSNSDYSDWILKVSTDSGIARCSICQCNFNIRNMGEAALKSHAKGEKHKKNVQKKSEYRNQFMLSYLFFFDDVFCFSDVILML